MDAVDSSGLVIPISLWVTHLPVESTEPRCLVVMEPVERTKATVTFDGSVSFNFTLKLLRENV